MNLSELLDLTSETEYFSKIFGGIDSSRIDLGLNIFEPAVVCALSTIWKNSNAPILILTSTPKKSSEIYSNLKRTSTVTGEPKSEHKAEDVGKVKADIESSKIKQLIKNLGKD